MSKRDERHSTYGCSDQEREEEEEEGKDDDGEEDIEEEEEEDKEEEEEKDVEASIDSCCVMMFNKGVATLSCVRKCTVSSGSDQFTSF